MEDRGHCVGHFMIISSFIINPGVSGTPQTFNQMTLSAKYQLRLSDGASETYRQGWKWDFQETYFF